MRFKRSSMLLVSAIALAAACNKGGGKSDSKDDSVAEEPAVQCDTAAGKIVVGNECKDPDATVDDKGGGDLQLQGGTLDVAIVQAGSVALATGLGLVGQADGAHLKSLKYRFQSIQICKSMETNGGSGFSNPQDCLEIYKGVDGEYGDLPPSMSDKKEDGKTLKYADATAFDAAVATYSQQVKDRHEAAKTDPNYIDLMNPSSLKKLAQQLQLTGKDAHEYNYGLVNWFRPIKVTAEVPMFDGQTPAQKVLYTHDGVAAVEKIGADATLKHVTNVTDLTVGPAAEAVLEHPNGGSWFHFAKPFVITADDITNKRNFKLDLTFNPDAIVQGFDNTFGAISDGTYSISVPMLHLTPIAHAADQKVIKETYLLSHDKAGSEPFLARVELYSLKGDAQKTVYGVDSQVLYKQGSTSRQSDFLQAFFLDQSEAAVSLKDYQKTVFLTLPRLQDKDQTGTVEITSSCTDGHPGFMLPEYTSLNCSDADMHHVDTIDVTLQGIVELP